MVIFLEASGMDELLVVVSAEEGGARGEVPQVVFEAFRASLGYVLVRDHLGAGCGGARKPQKTAHEFAADLGRWHDFGPHLLDHLVYRLVLNHGLQHGVLAAVHASYGS